MCINMQHQVNHNHPRNNSNVNWLGGQHRLNRICRILKGNHKCNSELVIHFHRVYSAYNSAM